MIEPVETRTWLIGRIGNQEVASEVLGWWLDEEGVNPLTVGEWSGCRDGEIFKGSALGAVKVAYLRKLDEVAERCTTVEALTDLRRIAKWLVDWQPGDPGLSLAGGDAEI